MTRSRLGVIAWMMAAASLPCGGVAAQQSPPATKPTVEAAPDDIIVEGYRDRATLPTKVDPPAAASAVRHRQLYEMSERVAKCAARSRLAPTGRLRAVVDGEFNSPSHAMAQDRLRRIYISCGEGWSMLGISTAGAPPMTMGGGMSASGGRDGTEGAINGAPVSTDPAPLGHSIFDRGAFVIEAMRRYAPDLTLTRGQTGDPEVQRRFDLREIPRNRFRLPEDTHYFAVATCMVRVRPELAVRLVMQRDPPALLDDLQAALINGSRACVGNAERVAVDATQFRIYIADALYRWVVAARNVGSLIPAAG